MGGCPEWGCTDFLAQTKRLRLTHQKRAEVERDRVRECRLVEEDKKIHESLRFWDFIWTLC
jgi:hypothetical protein